MKNMISRFFVILIVIPLLLPSGGCTEKSNKWIIPCEFTIGQIALDEEGYAIFALPEKRVFEYGEPIIVRYILINNSEYEIWPVGVSDMLAQSPFEKINGERYEAYPLKPSTPFGIILPNQYVSWTVNLCNPKLVGTKSGSPDKKPGKYRLEPKVAIRRSGTPAGDFYPVEGPYVEFEIVP